MEECAVKINRVIEGELEYIKRRRSKDDNETPRSANDVAGSLIGLALSGGGIRSATTNLGILQALSRMGILPMVDYLCTVSGGGYIGSCLSSLLSLNACDLSPNFKDIEKEKVQEFRSGNDAVFTTRWDSFPFCADESCTNTFPKAQIKHLRTHGTFLIARLGVFTREAMRSVGNVLSGIVYHLLIALLFLFSLSAFYMGVVSVLAPELDQVLHKSPFRAATFILTGVDYNGLSAGDNLTISEPSAESGTTGLSDHLKHKGDFLYTVIKALACNSENGLIAFLLLFSSGFVVALLALWVVCNAITCNGLWRPKEEPKTGESEEDAFECSLLCNLYLGFIVIALDCVLVVRYTLFSARPPGIEVLPLLFPFIFFLGARIATFLVHLLAHWYTPAWTRQFRSLWGAIQAFTSYGLLITLVMGLFPFLVYALADYGLWAALGALGSLIFSRFIVGFLSGRESKKMKIPQSLLKLALAIAVGIFLLLVVLVFCTVIVNHRICCLVWCLTTFAAFLLLGYLVNLNKLSPHYFYRDRLIEAYLRTDVDDGFGRMITCRDDMEMALSDLHGKDNRACKAPYHLISAAINLTGSRDLTRKDRKSGYFLFSKFYCGSEQTGYRETKKYRRGETKLARAMTISGAALGSAMGFHSFFAQSFAMSLFNIRLGYWLENPKNSRSLTRQEGWIFWPKYLLKEMFCHTRATDSLVNLSDGGHTGDNVGIYPLLQRRCKIIIACDAERDTDLTFGSFTEALRHAYIDMGIDVDIDLTMIRPDTNTGYSRNHCAIGRIRYPDCPAQKSWLIYLKNSLSGDEPEPVLNYKLDNPTFPHQSTADQFFDDAQFEGYRALGDHIVEQTFRKWISIGEFNRLCQEHLLFEPEAKTSVDRDRMWTCLQIMHSTHREMDDIDFQNLNDKLIQLQQLFLANPSLGKYYDECYRALSTRAPSEVTQEVAQACMAQTRLMEEVFFARKLYRYGNAPANHGWMNLFRQWGRSETFKSQFKKVKLLFSPKFVAFYENYIENHEPIREDPIPHPWDVKPVRAKGHGIFLDSGRS